MELERRVREVRFEGVDFGVGEDGDCGWVWKWCVRVRRVFIVRVCR